MQNDVAATYGNDEDAAAALREGVAIVDHSHWGRLRVTGDDRLTFLHGQSTADMKSLRQGSGSQTVRCRSCIILGALFPGWKTSLPCIVWESERVNATHCWRSMMTYLLSQVFVNRTGRTIDLATCLVQGNSVLVILSPSRRTVVKDRLEQYIFFGDKVRRPL